MTSRKKGDQWHFGMQAHIGSDAAHRLGAHGGGRDRQGGGPPRPDRLMMPAAVRNPWREPISAEKSVRSEVP